MPKLNLVLFSLSLLFLAVGCSSSNVEQHVDVKVKSEGNVINIKIFKKHGLLFCSGTVNEKNGDILIDTGANISSIFENALTPSDDTFIHSVTTYSASGMSNSARFVKVVNIKIDNVELIVHNASVLPEPELNITGLALLHLSILKGLNAYIDFDKMEMTFNKLSEKNSASAIHMPVQAAKSEEGQFWTGGNVIKIFERNGQEYRNLL
jgi:predicted aspartyl protease